MATYRITLSDLLLWLALLSPFLLLPSHAQPPQCGCEAPAPAPSASILNPDPDLFLNRKQYLAYLVIQLFKLTITCDPQNVTASWVGFRPCATYQGFYCEAPPNSPETPTIASVDFNGFRLCAPTLVGFLDQLPDLALFHANSNNFSGPVPDLTGLPFLYQLDLSNNDHSGAFPADLLPLANLSFLDIRFNRFVGTVAPAIFSLGLDAFFLNNNLFNQPLPETLGSSPVAYLTLAYNGFTGPIPRSIGNMSNTLLEVLFLGNKLSGCLPVEIGLLGNITVFDAGDNYLTGKIPWAFGCLRKVEQLNLARNLLYGEVPDAVCLLAKTGEGNLANLSLSGNYFTSLGPACWELIKNQSAVGVIDVRMNCIKWLPDQRPWEECLRFLWTPKPHCPPPFLHVPCRLDKWEPWKWYPSWPPQRRSPANGAPSRYVSYNMLHEPPKK
ncbi:uncharacterized protein At4g06744-like [Zingiber officinale]|uniref:uncharacterized protein At4g06744-like n=1 Tax=Zingiber officinale TaxID=94328 RepID=UPI001C4D6EC3|nr:uncharacterized protein At4g06744-like [Zingiber officinale]